jgi:hypothetical protein
VRFGRRGPFAAAIRTSAAMVGAPARFAFGWSRLAPSQPGPRRCSSRSVWVFLARDRFAAKPPAMGVGLSWISLDSLVLIETYQWVTRVEAGKHLSRAFSRREQRPEREPAAEAMRKRRIVHGASLRYFLIFCKRLWPEVLPFVRPDPKSSSSLWRARHGLRLPMAGAPLFWGANYLIEGISGSIT